MKSPALFGICALVLLLAERGAPRAEELLQYRDLFNGKDLTGWVNVNTKPETWTVRDGMLICSGQPIGVMRTDRQYENFLLHIEWMHMEAGGNSGVFAWSDGTFPRGGAAQGPRGADARAPVAVAQPGRTRQSPADRLRPRRAVRRNGLKTTPDNPRGDRSMSFENRCKGKGEWNVYDVVAVDGVIKLSVNGKFVNGISRASVRKGYLCLESEGAEIHFRNIRILELPPGMATPEQTAPVVN